jgi:HK97 family phage portal protein
MLPEPGSPEAPGIRQAAGIADVFGAVRVLVDGATMAPLQVFQKRSGGGREQVESGDTAALLDRPSPGVTQPAFVGELVANLALWGEVFVGKYLNPDGSIQQLGVLDPSRMEVELVGGQPRFKYHQAEGRVADNLTLDDVIHIRHGFTLDGIRGASPIRVCREAMALGKSLTEASSALWANGAVPGGILTVPPGGGGDDQAQALADGWDRRHKGAKKRGRVAVVTGEIKWQSVTMPLSDAEFIETRRLSTLDVCRILHVQPWMLAAATGESLTYSTVAEQARAFAVFSLGPWLRLIEQGLSADADLFPQPVSYCRFNLEGLLRADPAARASFYTAALNNETGWMTRAEVRELEDLPAEEATA